MILAIDGKVRHSYPELVDQMFRLRASTFRDRLGWDVVVVDGKETDRFDELDPLYLLSVDSQKRQLMGSVRLLPTTGPTMLRDVFSVLVPTGAVSDPLIWESSRFAINPAFTVGRRDPNGFANAITIELLCGIVEAALLANIEQIVSVFDARMARILRSVDCHYQLLGEPVRIGKTMTYAGLFEVSQTMRDRLAAAGKS